MAAIARVALWMSEGWSAVQDNAWTAPCYWQESDGTWQQFGPAGLAPLAA